MKSKFQVKHCRRYFVGMTFSGDSERSVGFAAGFLLSRDNLLGVGVFQSEMSRLGSLSFYERRR